MIVGHQLKKLAQIRGHNHPGPRWIEYLLKHWSTYTVIFSTFSLLVVFFSYYDIGSSPTSHRVMPNPGRDFQDALKAQVGDSYSFYLSPLSSTEIVTEDGKSLGPKEDHVESESMKEKWREKQNGSTPTQKIDTEELIKIKPELDVLSDPSSTQKDDSIPVKSFGEALPQLGTDLEAINVADQKESTEESSKQSTREITKDSDKQESTKESEKEVDKGAVVTEEVEKFNGDPPTEGKIGANALTEEDLRMQSSTESPVIDKICDFSKGEWVYDEKYPLYKPNSCPFVDGGFRCVENGRPSDEFQKWRWQPTGCDLPRFDAKKMLQRLRGSRMVFVGDSLGRNDFESMMCMLSEAVPDKNRIYETNGGPGHITKESQIVSFRFDDYDCIVEYYRSHYLVAQGDAPLDTDPRVKTTLKLDQIDPSASLWKDADILILNSGHWWTSSKTVQNGDYFQIGGSVFLNMTVKEAFRRAMETVALFTEENIDPATTQVFFRSYEPHHFKGGTWDHGGTCNDDNKPLQKLPFVYVDKTSNNMILKVMGSNVNNHVNFLNITYMSELRPDGHNSIWQNAANSSIHHRDCSHWCLPGVPDAWNEILFANLLRKGKGNWGRQAKSLD